MIMKMLLGVGIVDLDLGHHHHHQDLITIAIGYLMMWVFLVVIVDQYRQDLMVPFMITTQNHLHPHYQEGQLVYDARTQKVSDK